MYENEIEIELSRLVWYSKYTDTKKKINCVETSMFGCVLCVCV